MADRKGLDIEERKDIHAREQEVESRDNLVTSCYASS